MSLKQKLESVIQGASGTFGVAVKHLQTNETATINGERLFQLASTFKIPILATLYRDVQEGKISLTQRIKITEEDLVPGSGVIQQLDSGVEVTVKDLAMLMIIVSDNLATDRILKLVGTDETTSYMRELGLEKTYIRHSCWDLLSLSVGLKPEPYSQEALKRITAWKFDPNSIAFQSDPENNVGTPHDMAKLAELIATRKIISEDACEGMMEILFRQQFNSRLPYYLPPEAKVAHKTGTLASVVNDVGIIYLPYHKGMFTIAVLSEGNLTLEEGERTIGRLARVAYDHFLNS
ncbi:serine hydrolase [Brevibacillus daliensis]|uniref:serine hydrolase n=1 Tax=Brevibacillus daliensis TaxID=2892995 RepID=UPI001E430763|nr:serine hydrolase [Brevibacillus daliensis]